MSRLPQQSPWSIVIPISSHCLKWRIQNGSSFLAAFFYVDVIILRRFQVAPESLSTNPLPAAIFQNDDPEPEEVFLCGYFHRDYIFLELFSADMAVKRWQTPTRCLRRTYDKLHGIGCRYLDPEISARPRWWGSLSGNISVATSSSCRHRGFTSVTPAFSVTEAFCARTSNKYLIVDSIPSSKLAQCNRPAYAV